MTRRLQKGVALVLTLSLATSLLVSCGKTAAPTPKSTQQQNASANTAMRTFTDSVGREVQLPQTLERVAPSGPLAQIMLLTAFPNELCGIASKFGKAQQGYFDPKITNLPEFGQFYGKNASLNMEALAAAKPQVIIDIGDAKKTIKADMDDLMTKLNIPTVFIEANLKNMPQAYAKLGELFNTDDRKRIDELIAASVAILDNAKKIGANLSEDKKVKVYWAMGEDGLSTNAAKSFHSEALTLANVVNVADVEVVSKGGGSKISFEQLYLWKPDVIIADSGKIAKAIESSETWGKFLSETGAKVMIAPETPYGYLANPPSVNRLLGVDWLSAELYPEFYSKPAGSYVEAFFGKSIAPKN